MKKAIALLLTIIFVLGMTACQEKNTSSDDATETSEVTNTKTEKKDDDYIEAQPEKDGARVIARLSCDTVDQWETDITDDTTVIKHGPFGTDGIGEVDTVNKKEGSGCLSENGRDNMNAFLYQAVTFRWLADNDPSDGGDGPIDIGINPKNAAVRMWIYISNPDAVKIASKLQVGSAWIDNIDNYEFILGNSNDTTLVTHPNILTEGWNEVTFKFDDAAIVGRPDPSNINMIKFYALIMPDKTTVKIDDIRIIELPNS